MASSTEIVKFMNTERVVDQRFIDSKGNGYSLLWGLAMIHGCYLEQAEGLPAEHVEERKTHAKAQLQKRSLAELARYAGEDFGAGPSIWNWNQEAFLLTCMTPLLVPDKLSLEYVEERLKATILPPMVVQKEVAKLNTIRATAAVFGAS